MASSNSTMKVDDLEQKYFKLVWYARKPPVSNTEFWDALPADIKEGAQKVLKEVEEKYPTECTNLRCPIHGDWEHGFNSGMLAAMRLLRRNVKISQKCMSEFPNCDT